LHVGCHHGQQIFRFDTFGDERFWSGTLRPHQALAGARLGGVGPGVSPATALAVGLKVDTDMVPPQVLAAIRNGSVDLNDPANTQALIAAKAVVGPPVAGVASRCRWVSRARCAIRTLLFLDGKAFRPDGRTAATLIPPAYGLAGVNLQTYTGFGGVPYWNAFVGNLEMHGTGVFYDPRLNDAAKCPVAARAARPVTWRRCLASRGGRCIPPLRLASTISKQAVRLTIAIARRR
jgi:hypothetical protein